MNKIFFAIIGLLFIGVASTGVSAYKKTIATNENTAITTEENTLTSEQNIQTTQPTTITTQQTKTVTECTTVVRQGDDEDDGEGDDEDDSYTEEVCTTKEVPVITTTSTSNTTISNPTPVTPSTPTTPTYTLAQVSTHTSESSCWTVISGIVYNLTPFISQHPGGKKDIMRICGIDGTQAYNAQHGGAGQPARELAGLEIGTLSN